LSEPIILAADTCFGACSAAVVQGGSTLSHANEAMERGHAEALAPMVDAVVRKAGISFAELDRLAVTVGPGSFTGQRVGLAFMRGMRVALKKPLIGVTSLAAMAERARRESGASTAAAVHDAKRGEIYMEAVGISALSARVSPFAEARAELAKVSDLALTGTAAARLAREIGVARVIVADSPDAIWVGRLAAQIESSLPPRPLYLRAPDARLPMER